MALIFRGSKCSRIALREHFVEKISRIRGKTPHPQNGRDVLHLKTPVRADSTSYHRPLRRCVVFCDTLFPTSTLSEFVFRYLGVPLTFAGLSWQLQYWPISHMSDRTSWENSPCGSGSLHFHYCPSSLLKYTEPPS